MACLLRRPEGDSVNCPRTTPLSLSEKVAAVREWVDTGIAETLKQDPSGFMLGIASIGVLEVLDEVTEALNVR